MSEPWPQPSPPLPTLFAKLVPANLAARKAFSRIASHFKGGGGEGWSERYVVIDRERDEGVEGGSGSGSEGESVKRKIWTGWYVLDLGIPPRRPGVGMLIFFFYFFVFGFGVEGFVDFCDMNFCHTFCCVW